MPHFIAECTNNIREQLICRSVRQSERCAGGHGHLSYRRYPQRRAIWLDTVDGRRQRYDYAFVHMTLKIGTGRSPREPGSRGDAFQADQYILRELMAELLSGAVV